MKTIDRDELLERLEQPAGTVLLEALGERHYASGHLPGARLFPHERARELAAEVVPDKGATVVVYCASETCRNSHVAAGVLTSLGYADVRVYAGGKKDWTDAGLPLET